VSLSTSPIRATSSGHQFQDQPVSNLGRPENDLIDGILQLQVAMVPAERRDYRLIGAQGVFFEWDR